MGIMKKVVLLLGVAVTLLTGCSGNNQRVDRLSDIEKQQVEIQGQWYLENIVLSDSVNVRPSEEVPGSRQYILLTDSTYSIITNCNAISGNYTLKGDSICLSDGAMTEVACDNMTTEDALRKILPYIVTVDMENDSIMRLNCSVPSEYIVLRKATIEVK